MKKLLAVLLLGTALTGCGYTVNYIGSCYANGNPYNGKKYLYTECTRYCSAMSGEVCRESVAELKQAQADFQQEKNKLEAEEARSREEKLKQDLVNLETAKREKIENQKVQDKVICSGFGFTDKSEGMANCLMMEQSKRDAATQAAKEESMRQNREDELSAREASMYQQREQEQQQQLRRQQQYNQPAYVPPPRIEIPQLQYQPMQRKRTDLSCLNDCQQSGYQYGLCQSKCSY